MSALFIIFVGLTVTLFSEKMLISNICIGSFMPNLKQKILDGIQVWCQELNSFFFLHHWKTIHVESRKRVVYRLVFKSTWHFWKTTLVFTILDQDENVQKIKLNQDDFLLFFVFMGIWSICLYYGYTMAKYLFLCGPYSNPNPK